MCVRSKAENKKTKRLFPAPEQTWEECGLKGKKHLLSPNSSVRYLCYFRATLITKALRLSKATPTWNTTQRLCNLFLLLHIYISGKHKHVRRWFRPADTDGRTLRSKQLLLHLLQLNVKQVECKRTCTPGRDVLREEPKTNKRSITRSRNTPTQWDGV